MESLQRPLNKVALYIFCSPNGANTSHCYLPRDLIETTVIPLLKTKSDDVSDVNDYRTIALSSCWRL